jgi:hypothetical protein
VKPLQATQPAVHFAGGQSSPVVRCHDNQRRAPKPSAGDTRRVSAQRDYPKV